MGCLFTASINRSKEKIELPNLPSQAPDSNRKAERLNTQSYCWVYRAQLGAPGNYSALAAAGVTVVNMHQGNEINPWINCE